MGKSRIAVDFANSDLADAAAYMQAPPPLKRKAPQPLSSNEAKQLLRWTGVMDPTRHGPTNNCGKPWTGNQENALRMLWTKGYSFQDIARVLRRTRCSIAAQLKLRGVLSASQYPAYRKHHGRLCRFDL